MARRVRRIEAITVGIGVTALLNVHTQFVNRA
jgi:hypothetical protein